MKIRFTKRIVLLLAVALVLLLLSGIRFNTITGLNGSGYTLGINYSFYQNLSVALLIFLIVVGIIKSDW